MQASDPGARDRRYLFVHLIGAPTPCGLHTAGVEERAALTQARSMLILLLGACKQTQTALEAAANALDTDLRTDLGAMIERTERELVALNAKINALPG